MNTKDKRAKAESRLRASELRLRELRERIAEARGRGEDTSSSEELLKLLEDSHEWFVADLALHSTADHD
jgi:hypothetical protein